jgi:hypothetical protein
MRPFPLLAFWFTFVGCGFFKAAPDTEETGPQTIPLDTDGGVVLDTDDTDLPQYEEPPEIHDTAAGCPYLTLTEVRSQPLAGQSGRIEQDTSTGFTDDYLYDDSDYTKIGIRQNWGGSVIFFGLADGNPGMNSTNTIDANDPGREVQFALYDPDRMMQGCAHDASCQSGGTACGNSIRYLGWNPVQGGNRCGEGSGMQATNHASGRLMTATIPLQWNPDWDKTQCSTDGCTDGVTWTQPSDVRVTQTARFVRTHVVELTYTVQEEGGNSHAATMQEMPTVYTANGTSGPDLWRLLDAGGTQVDINEPANDGFFVKNFTSPAPWVSLQNDNSDYGVGILYENGLTEFQGWQNRSMPFNNVRALFEFGLPAHSTVSARAYLLLGGFSTIQNEANWLLDNLPPFGILDGPSGGVPGPTIFISGWAQDNRGVTKVDAIIDDWLTIPLTYGADRPDVCTTWPGYPNCSAVDFNGEFSLAQVGWQAGCDHKIEIRAEDADGNSRIIDRGLWSVE